MICLKQTLMDLKEVGRSPRLYVYTHSEASKDENIKIQRAIHTKKKYIDDEFFMSFVGFLMLSLRFCEAQTHEHKRASTTSSTHKRSRSSKNHINPACEKIENYIQFMTTEVLCDAVVGW